MHVIILKTTSHSDCWKNSTQAFSLAVSDLWTQLGGVLIQNHTYNYQMQFDFEIGTSQAKGRLSDSLLLQHSRLNTVRGGVVAHLHATETDPDAGRRALLALADLHGFFFLGRVVTVLPCAHLQIQNARHCVTPCQVLQQDKLWGGGAMSRKASNKATTHSSCSCIVLNHFYHKAFKVITEFLTDSTVLRCSGGVFFFLWQLKDTVLVAVLSVLLHPLQVLLVAL